MLYFAKLKINGRNPKPGFLIPRIAETHFVHFSGFRRYTILRERISFKEQQIEEDVWKSWIDEIINFKRYGCI